MAPRHPRPSLDCTATLKYAGNLLFHYAGLMSPSLALLVVCLLSPLNAQPPDMQANDVVGSRGDSSRSAATLERLSRKANNELDTEVRNCIHPPLRPSLHSATSLSACRSIHRSTDACMHRRAQIGGGGKDCLATRIGALGYGPGPGTQRAYSRIRTLSLASEMRHMRGLLALSWAGGRAGGRVSQKYRGIVRDAGVKDA